MYERFRTILVLLLTVIAGVYLITLLYHTALTFAHILFLYFSAWLIQFFLSPIVDWLVAHHFPRLLAVIYVYLLLAALIAIFFLSAVPVVLSEAEAFTRQFPKYDQHTLTLWGQQVQDFLVHHTPLRRANIATFVREYTQQLSDQIAQINRNLVTMTGALGGATVNTVAGALNVVQNSLNWLLNAVVILVLSFYMTLDGPRLSARVAAALPPPILREGRQINVAINRMFGGYLRGQMILSTIYAILTYITLLWVNAPFQIVLAVFSGIMMLIPFIGSFLAVLPPVIIYAIHAGDIWAVAKVAFALFIWQQVTLNLLAPRILGDSVGIHPLLIFLGVLMGTQLAGPWGAIFGVPVLGVALAVGGETWQRWLLPRWRRWQTTPPPEAEPLAAPLPVAVVAPPATPAWRETLLRLWERVQRTGKSTSTPEPQGGDDQRSISSVSSTTSSTPTTRDATSAARSPSSSVSTVPRK